MSERIVNVSSEGLQYNGKTFRSKLETKVAEALDKLGIPYAYEERKIVLQEGFRCPYQKSKVRELTYTPDFEIGSSVLIECKGFETPEWKIKKKLLFKWLMENEPGTCFYQIHDAGKQLLQTLDHNWQYLGFAIEVTSKPKKGESKTWLFDSIEEAMECLSLKGKNVGPILKSLTGEKQWVYNYNFKLVKIKL